MTYLEIVNEILNLRFNENRRSMAQRWVGIKEMEVWSAYDWPFKVVRGATLTIASGNISPTMPTGFFKVLKNGLQDDLGSKLTYLEPDLFDSYYVGTSNTYQGRPQEYTIVNGVLYLGPTPDTGYTFTVSYQRTYVHLNGAGAVTAGPMSADTDTPIWDSQFHFLLVPAAMGLGLKLENDPTSGPIDQEYAALMARMADHYLPTDSSETRQYGADNLGYEFA